MLILIVQAVFFEKYFPPFLNSIFLYLLIAFFIIFPIAEILKKRARKKHENRYN